MVNRQNFEKALRAALEGPEVKKIKIEKHEYNVKPVKVERRGAQLHVRGQISHHLSWSDDDQVFYRFAVTPGQVLSIADIDIEIDGNFIRSTMTAVWDGFLKKALIELLERKFEQAGQETFKLSVAQATSEQVVQESQKLLDGSWQREADFLIVNIAARVSLGAAVAAKSKADPLGVALRLTATSGTTTRTRAGDHRSVRA